MLLLLVEPLPRGSLHHGETAEHEVEVSKERLEVFLIASVARWEAADWRVLVSPF